MASATSAATVSAPVNQAAVVAPIAMGGVGSAASAHTTELIK
jgi:hypothetical protein